MGFDFGDAEQILAPLQTQWKTRWKKQAQPHRVCPAPHPPDEVLPEWQKQQIALGSSADVQRFVQSACARLNAPLEPHRANSSVCPSAAPARGPAPAPGRRRPGARQPQTSGDWTSPSCTAATRW
jgi:hypothetical protein